MFYQDPKHASSASSLSFVELSDEALTKNVLDSFLQSDKMIDGANTALKNDTNYEFFKFKTENYQTDKYKVMPDKSWVAVFNKEMENVAAASIEDSEKIEIQNKIEEERTKLKDLLIKDPNAKKAEITKLI